MLATLETTEMRSEDAVSDSLAHTEMTREPYANPAVMRLFSQQGISDEQGWEVLNSMVEQGIVPNAAVFLETFEHMSETESEYSDRADPSHLIETTPFSPQTRTPFLQERAADNDFQDRRHMEGHTVADELDTTEFGNEDATLDSFTHSEMTREPYTHPESTVQLSQQGSSDEQRLELLKIMLGVFRTNALVIPQPFQSMSQIGSTQLSEERLTVSEVMCNISEARARFWKAAWNGFFTLVHRQNTTAVGALNVVAAKKVQIVEKPLFAGIDKDAVEAGADKDAKTRAGETALHLAAELDLHGCVKKLLKAGAEKDAVTADGQTALHLAARRGNWHSVRNLLEEGADRFAKTSAGETAFSLADKGGHSMVTWELNRADKVLSRRDMAAVHKTVMIFSMSWLTLRHVKARMRRQAADLRLRHDASPRPVLAREFSMVRSTTVLLLRNRIRQVLRRMH
ncbi:Receptor-interacting serine/threonine-protein kinase 4 (Ankyrin repeat domain-containing protein 3) (PKC-delta-interacting protein kinase) [Durusdinium trenchii]